MRGVMAVLLVVGNATAGRVGVSLREAAAAAAERDAAATPLSSRPARLVLALLVLPPAPVWLADTNVADEVLVVLVALLRLFPLVPLGPLPPPPPPPPPGYACGGKCACACACSWWWCLACCCSSGNTDLRFFLRW